MPKKAPPTGFAGQLKALREAAGLTQDELAEKTGLYKFSIAKLEQAVREPTWSTVLTLARALGVSCEAFLADGEEVPPAEPKRGPGRPSKPKRDRPAPAPKRPRGRPRGKS
jgi:transcriptional regulator with XRE-family HTH domain